MALDSTFQFYNDGVNSIINEPILISSAVSTYPLKHSNATNITLYTGLNSTGSQVSIASVTNDSDESWYQILNLDISTRTTYDGIILYANYTITGDMWDSRQAQLIYDELVRVANIVDSSSSSVSIQVASTTPIDETSNYNLNTVTATFNKYIDSEGNTNKLKVFPTSLDRTNGTNEISGTVVNEGNKSLKWTASSALNPSTMYYPIVNPGVLGQDGTQLGSAYTWEFQTQANQAPVASSVSVSGTTTLGSTLTGSYTYSDNESNPEGTSTFRWLRNDVAIAGATANTYVIIEADLGKTIKFEVTPVAQTGTSPGLAVASSGTAIPVPAPPSISVVAGDAQTTTTFTANSTLSTETYNLYWSTTTGVTKSNGTKITGVTSPYVHTGRTNDIPYYYVLVMEVNGVESAESAQQSATPSANPAPTATITVTNPSTTQMTVAGTVSGIGGGDTLTTIRVAYQLQGTDADADAAVTAGRYFDITAGADLTAYQGAGYTKTGLTLTAGATYIPHVKVYEV